MNASSTPAASASGPRPLTDAVTEIRATDPGRIGRALAQRPRADLAGAGLGHWHVAQFHHVGAAEPLDDVGLHGLVHARSIPKRGGKVNVHVHSVRPR